MEVPAPLDKHFDNIFTKDVDKKEVHHLFNSQKEETAAGFDKISVKLIKIILPLIIDPLITIYNKSLKEVIFPTQFKVAIVKPIFKKGDKQSLGNYRPISIISIFAKILEKIVKNRLIIFLEENNLLSKNQFGFRKGPGTILMHFIMYQNISITHLTTIKKLLLFFWILLKSSIRSTIDNY